MLLGGRWCFWPNLVDTFLGWTISPKGSNQADMMLNHAIYNATIFNEKMAPGYKLIVPTREPVSWFKSVVLDSHVSETPYNLYNDVP